MFTYLGMWCWKEVEDTMFRKQHLTTEVDLENTVLGQVWWYPLVIPLLWKLRQEDYKFKASLDHSGIPPYLKKKK